jgi:hypothetical protein
MPARFVTLDRETPLLLPPDLREWVPEDHFSKPDDSPLALPENHLWLPPNQMASAIWH